MMQQDKLTLKQKMGFGVCDLGGNLFFTVIGFVLLNYLTDSVGISAGLAGTIVMIGKLWDAITDPLTGYISDKTRTRWGRRRPFILFGSIPLFLSMIIMFTNPHLSSQIGLFIWGVLSFCLLCTAYTLVNIPYNSLTPEMTKDFHERTSLNGYRFSFAVVGTLLGAGAALPIVNAFSSRDLGYTMIGVIFGFLMMATALITFFSVRETEAAAVAPTVGFFKTYLRVFRNRPFVLILLTYTAHLSAITIVSGIAIYYFKYIHHDESKTTLAMVTLLGVAMLFIPVSVKLSRTFGKKPVYASGMVIFSIAMMVLSFLGHLYGLTFSLLMMVLAGVGAGFIYALPWAMVPDAVEYDYLLTGERTEGAFYGIWTFGTKIGQALALGITGAVLSLTGYIPDVVQTEAAALGIRMLLGPVSTVFFMLALLVLYFYPINEERYAEIMADIRQMEGRKVA
ncbi:MAG: MFS transporter [bacterium]